MVKLVWRHHPQSVLLVKKPRDPDITAALVKVVEMLKSLGVVNIFVEVPVYDELRDAGSSVLGGHLAIREQTSGSDARKIVFCWCL